MSMPNEAIPSATVPSVAKPADPELIIDALCIGETMVMMTPADGGRLATAKNFALTCAGAESNVAVHLSRAGLDARWVSRLGADPLGDRVLGDLAAYGVGLDLVQRSETEPTGMFFKDPVASGSEVFYYRAGSAAAAMGPGLIAPEVLAAARLVHLTGITPGLSQGCLALTEQLFAELSGSTSQLLSFDVNFRAKVWSKDVAATVLLDLARRAHVVLVGRDEAEELWGAADPTSIRALLPGVAYLVIKDADIGATEFVLDAAGVDHATFVPAPYVDVVEPVGAGDAFAGGYLAALLAGAPSTERLARGHRTAGEVLVVHGDLPAAHQNPVDRSTP